MRVEGRVVPYSIAERNSIEEQFLPIRAICNVVVVLFYSSDWCLIAQMLKCRACVHLDSDAFNFVQTVFRKEYDR